MSRISRYQDSVHRFMKHMSCVNDMSPGVIRDGILSNIDTLDHTAGIILLTVLNKRGKKINKTFHGYYMASGMELIEVIISMIDKKEKNTEIITEILCHTSYTLTQYIESIQTHFPPEYVLKAYCSMNKFITNKLSLITKHDTFELENPVKINDLAQCNYSNKTITEEYITGKIAGLKQIKSASIMNYVNNKYGSCYQLSLLLGWELSGGDDKIVKILEKIGNSLGMLVKISTDFGSIEHDILRIRTHDTYSTNLIINNGIQNTFELFSDNKQKFIDGCLTTGIYTNTVKEIVDLMEGKIDIIIDNTTLDVKSQYTKT